MHAIRYYGKPRSSPSSTGTLETDISRPGLEPASPRWETSTLARAIRTAYMFCFSEPILYVICRRIRKFFKVVLRLEIGSGTEIPRKMMRIRPNEGIF
jgi:hypothetical protein